MKIAVQTDETGQVVGYSTIYDAGQLKITGWQEIEADPYFNAGNYADWKVVNSQLVKKDTGMTPLEESQMAVTALTQQNIQLAQENTELKAAVTATTKELVTTKAEIKQTQQAITALTQLQIGQTTNK
ncbi:hypothetical protein DS831_04755 [Bombilactobacillus bombi]|uniref:Uncharacterized protein n=1 Tax=Bombilactobacillus bombi TaxID=1303590 RepID=A0A417ZID4_9LACO|nr:hypothetical protein [Bombilactobacillus bombi]RHW51335.1 hypothetical protein DS831_04755 [Bombilactobacillus bombi]